MLKECIEEMARWDIFDISTVVCLFSVDLQICAKNEEEMMFKVAKPIVSQIRQVSGEKV